MDIFKTVADPALDRRMHPPNPHKCDQFSGSATVYRRCIFLKNDEGQMLS